MVKATLVLEGGANRGVFTSGVLDNLMEKDMYMSNVIGVSAGACNAVDYVSKQAGRSRECVIHREKEYDYVYGLKKTLKEKALMDMDMLFDKFPNEIYPFDFETYFASEMECELVVTNCITGDAEYLSEDKDPERLMKICRASSSMPLAAPIANVDGIPYMDGGLADSIPIEYALEKGNDKIVVVLTRNPGYRKKRAVKATEQLYKRAYKKYPNLVRTIMTRNAVYNKQMKLIEKLEEEGKQYDVVILDPPAFTKSRKTIKNATKGYREINMRGMKLVKPGGYLATCSCSHFMDYELFTKTIHQAAQNVHKRVRQVEYRTQAPDHPILWSAEESYYLKFYVFQIVDEK